MYERNLAAPENYGMPAIHSKRSDIYQFGKAQWEAFTVNFDNFPHFFEEARGLQGGLDLQQVTLRHRRTKREICGLTAFLVWQDIDFNDVLVSDTDDPDKPEGDSESPAGSRRLSVMSPGTQGARLSAELRVKLGKLCARCLQQREADRVSAFACGDLLRAVLRKMEDCRMVVPDQSRHIENLATTYDVDGELDAMGPPFAMGTASSLLIEAGLVDEIAVDTGDPGMSIEMPPVPRPGEVYR